MTVIPIVGFIFSAAWLTHVVTSKEFYDTSVNSKYPTYLTVLILNVIMYFACWIPYFFYELEATTTITNY